MLFAECSHYRYYGFACLLFSHSCLSINIITITITHHCFSLMHPAIVFIILRDGGGDLQKSLIREFYPEVEGSCTLSFLQDPNDGKMGCVEIRAADGEFIYELMFEPEAEPIPGESLLIASVSLGHSWSIRFFFFSFLFFFIPSWPNLSIFFLSSVHCLSSSIISSISGFLCS